MAETPKPLAREWTRPDFMCGLVDAQVEPYLFFVVECKRLGWPSAGGSVFNRLYTEEGVRRFVQPDWGYGEGAESGAMIGYVQTMSPDDTLKEVNGYGEEANVPAIKKEADEWIDRGVTRLNQTLDRNVSPSPFRLRHIWVDLRHRYATSIGMTQRPSSGQ